MLVGAYALAACVLIVLPALFFVEDRLERALIEEQIHSLTAQEEILVGTASRRVRASERSVARLASRISGLSSEVDAVDRARFDTLVARDADGAWRSRREHFEPLVDAGIWIPRHGALDDSIACWLVRAKRVIEEASLDADDPLFANAWLLLESRGEVIHWPEGPEFIYQAGATDDYGDTPWMELARPERNPEGRPRWTRLSFDPIPRVWMISVVAPFTRDGRHGGSVGHDVPLSRLLSPSLALAARRDTAFLLVDSERRIIASSEHSEQMLAAGGDATIDDIPDAALRPLVARLFDETSINGGVRRLETDTLIVLGTRVSATGWLVVSSIPRSSIGGALRTPLTTMRIATIVALGLVLLATVLTVAHERRRLREAQAAAREAELKLLHAQKMEAVGRLAGGVAHDFNNLVTVISGFATLAARRAPPDDPVLREHLTQIDRATLRAADLTRQLLAFARVQPVEPRVVDLNALLRDLHKLLRRLISESVELITLPASEPACVRIDVGQLEQVLSNLAVNAKDAMPDGGKLTMAVEVSGRDVVLRVTDTGTGMSDEVKAHVFEPFFTTKEVGRGTGLGLSTSFAIVQQAGGTLEVESELGRGATFIVRLPRVDERPELEGERDISSPGKSVASGVVLLVEDDPQVRQVTADLLRQHGFSIVEAENGAVAIELVERGEQRFDCMLTDVVMPILGGGELVRRIRLLAPDLPIIVMSGYVDDPSLRADASRLGVEFVAKPFETEELVEKLRAAIGDHRRASERVAG